MRKLLAIGIISAALMAACGDGNDDTSDPYASPSGAPAATTQAPDGSAPIAAGGDCTDNSKADGPGDLEMQDFQFAPPCLQINVEQGLRLHNEGAATHNFSVETIPGLDVDVASGEENNTEATGLTVGEYTIFCKFHRESNNMEGKLRLVAA